MRASNQPAPVVVIPVYKHTLSNFEWISLNRTFKILGGHPILLLSPSGQLKAIDQAIKQKLPQACYAFHPVEDHWLDSVASYNHLMTTNEFYRHYVSYTHILIAQLDAYVFSDQLIHWCNAPWSYIGAPIYPQGCSYGEANCQAIGCGGFSLRKVGDFVHALDANSLLPIAQIIVDTVQGFSWKGTIAKLAKASQLLISGDYRLCQRYNHLHRLLGINEDVLFGRYAPKIYPWFQVADYQSACEFSLDRYIANDLRRIKSLPFGTHGWYSSDANLSFWKTLIPELAGVNLPVINT